MAATSLTRARDFARVHATGRRARSDGVTVIVAPSEDPEAPSKLGLSVGRSTGGAVVRNRVKRRVRAAWRSSAPPPGYDVVVRPSPSAATAAFQDLATHLKSALTRAVDPGTRR